MTERDVVATSAISENSTAKTKSVPITFLADPWITELAVQDWAQGVGEYRAYTFNSEKDPCLSVESVRKGGAASLENTWKLCNFRVNEKLIILGSGSFSSLSSLNWTGLRLDLEVEYLPRRSLEERRYHCGVDMSKSAPAIQCLAPSLQRP